MLEHYLKVRALFASSLHDAAAKSAIHSLFKSPFTQRFPLTQALSCWSAFLDGHSHPPLLLEGHETLPVAYQCELVLLWLALAKLTNDDALFSRAKALGSELTPLVDEGLTTLWTPENQMEETPVLETFAKAIGRTMEPSSLERPPFFAMLEALDLSMQVVQGSIPRAVTNCAFEGDSSDPAAKDRGEVDISNITPRPDPSQMGHCNPFKSAICDRSRYTSGYTLFSEPGRACAYAHSGVSFGAMRFDALRILAFGIQSAPFSDPRLFGSEGVLPWLRASSSKETWVHLEPAPFAFSLQTIGSLAADPLFLSFYVNATECHVGAQAIKPKSLTRFRGQTASVRLVHEATSVTLEVDRPLNAEIIPLAGGSCFWGASFLLAFQLAPMAGKVQFKAC